MTPVFVDRGQVARRFARVAGRYGQGDFLVREIDRRMLARLDYVRLEPQRILDLGCSEGGSFGSLAERYPASHLIGLDLVPAMLRASRPARPAWQRLFALGKPAPARLAADAARLPLKPASIGLVWSNLLLHWLNDPLPAFAEVSRVLEVGGLLMFSTFGPDTLKELRAAFADDATHTQRFADMHDLGDMLVESGFSDPVMDMEVITLTYDSLDAMLAEIRASGSSCAMHERPRGLAGREAWGRMRAAYESMRRDGKLPATFEVIYGHAWKAAPRQAADGRAIIRFDALKK